MEESYVNILQRNKLHRYTFQRIVASENVPDSNVWSYIFIHKEQKKDYTNDKLPKRIENALDNE